MVVMCHGGDVTCFDVMSWLRAEMKQGVFLVSLVGDN